MDITLSGLKLVVNGPLTWQKSPPFARSIRTTGQHLRSDIQPVPQWAPDDLTEGLGRKWYKTGAKQFWFGSANTLWPRQITLPGKQTAGTHTSDPTVQYTHYIHFRGTTYAFGVVGGALRSAAWSGTGYGAPVTVIAANVVAIHGVVLADDTLVVLYSLAANALYTTTSTDGTTWGAGAARSGISPAVMTYNPIDHVIYYAAYNSTTKAIELYKSADKAATWAAVATTTFISGYGPTGIAMFTYSTTVVPYVACPEGVLVAPSAPAASQLFSIMSFSGIYSTVNGVGMTVWQNQLVIPAIGGQVWTYSTAGVAAPIGLDSADGLPASYIGNITAVHGDRNLLYVAVNAAKSGIYVYDGIGWHIVWLSSTNVTIPGLTTCGVSTPALLFSPVAGTYSYILNTHTNPLETTTATYESEGYVEFPIFGSELPEILGGFVKLAVYAHSLTDSESIVLSTSIDSGTYVDQVQIKDAETVVRLDLSGRDVQLKATLYRGSDTTKTPVLHYPIMTVNKAGSGLWSIGGTVDVAQSARRSDVTAENIVAQVIALANNPGHIQLEVGGQTYFCLMSQLGISELSPGSWRIRFVLEQIP